MSTFSPDRLCERLNYICCIITNVYYNVKEDSNRYNIFAHHQQLRVKGLNYKMYPVLSEWESTFNLLLYR